MESISGRNLIQIEQRECHKIASTKTDLVRNFVPVCMCVTGDAKCVSDLGVVLKLKCIFFKLLFYYCIVSQPKEGSASLRIKTRTNSKIF